MKLPFLIISLGIGISISLVVYVLYVIEEIRFIPISVMVDDGAGFDINNTALKFGKVIPGKSTNIRYVSISHKMDYPLEVIVDVFGDIKDFVSISEKRVVIKPNESKKIAFKISVPMSTNFGEYSGRVRFVFKKL